MNISFIIGVIIAIISLVYGILSSGTSAEQVINSFINMPGVYITFGGAIAATVMSVPFKYIKDLPKSFRVLMKKDTRNLEEYIVVLVDLAKEARTNGMLSLEDMAGNLPIKDDFLEYCVMLLVDAVEPHKVKAQIEAEMDNIETRHSYTWKVVDTLGSFGPAFGMIGTLIGLINMLANMDGIGGADSLGKGMSVALVTTLYGSILANSICAPISNRLKTIHDEEIIIKELIMEGVLAIQEGGNPNYVKEKLSSFISAKDRGKLK